MASKIFAISGNQQAGIEAVETILTRNNVSCPLFEKRGPLIIFKFINLITMHKDSWHFNFQSCYELCAIDVKFSTLYTGKLFRRQTM